MQHTTAIAFSVSLLLGLSLPIWASDVSANAKPVSSKTLAFLCSFDAVVQILVRPDQTIDQRKIMQLPNNFSCPMWSTRGDLGLIVATSSNEIAGQQVKSIHYYMLDARTAQLNELLSLESKRVSEFPVMVPGTEFQFIIAVNNELRIYGKNGFRRVASVKKLVCRMAISHSGRWLSVKYGGEYCGHGLRFDGSYHVFDLKTGNQVTVPSLSNLVAAALAYRWTDYDNLRYEAIDKTTQKVNVYDYNPKEQISRALFENMRFEPSDSFDLLPNAAVVHSDEQGTHQLIHLSGARTALPQPLAGCERRYSYSSGAHGAGLLWWVDLWCKSSSKIGMLDFNTGLIGILQIDGAWGSYIDASADGEWVAYSHRKGPDEFEKLFNTKTMKIFDLGTRGTIDFVQ